MNARYRAKSRTGSAAMKYRCCDGVSFEPSRSTYAP